MSAAAPSGGAKLAATVEQAREAMPTAGRDVRGRREATCLADGAALIARLPAHNALGMLSHAEGAGRALRRLMLHCLTDELGQAHASLRQASDVPACEPTYYLPAPGRYAG